MASRRIRVCDFGCGSGNFGLPLAAMLPTLDFVLLDRNPYAVQLAEEKATTAGLKNVVQYHAMSIEDYPKEDSFDICIAMHACGMATDGALKQALQRDVPYILCPCCIGKLNSGGVRPPSSRWLEALEASAPEPLTPTLRRLLAVPWISALGLTLALNLRSSQNSLRHLLLQQITPTKRLVVSESLILKPLQSCHPDLLSKKPTSMKSVKVSTW